ncbi:MAG: IS607 family transposase, partial [Promethearchaeia archaeon]
MYSIGDAAAMLGVSTRTLRRWENAGKIKCIRMVGGYRRFPMQEIMRIMGSGEGIRKNNGDANADDKKSCAIYARVSGHKQSKRGDLARQIESLKAYC